MASFREWFGRGRRPAEPTVEERQAFFGGVLGSGYYGGAPIYQSQASGLYVDSTDGLRSLAMVWGCIRLITQRLASLPRRVIDADGNIMPKPDWIEKPNSYSTGTDVISQMVVSLLIDGNAFAIREIDEMGRVCGFHVPHPAQVEVLLLQEPSGLTYWFVGSEVPPDALQHAKYLAPPGFIRGISPLDSLRQQVEIGQASQEYQKYNLESGAAIQYAITTKASLDRKERTSLRAEIEAKHHSPKKSSSPMIFGGGDMSITPLSITPQQMEFINQSKMTDVVICGQGFGIDPTIMGVQQSGSQLTYQNSQQRERQLWLDTLKPVAKLVEECLSNMLPEGQFFDLDESELMHGSHSDRVDAAQKFADANSKGVMFATPDEIRAVLGLPPLTAQQLLQLEQMQPQPMPPEMSDDELGDAMGEMMDEGESS